MSRHPLGQGDTQIPQREATLPLPLGSTEFAGFGYSLVGLERIAYARCLTIISKAIDIRSIAYPEMEPPRTNWPACPIHHLDTFTARCWIRGQPACIMDVVSVSWL
jgi:hypothetical protein